MAQNPDNATQPGLGRECKLTNSNKPALFSGFPAPQFRQTFSLEGEAPTSELVWFTHGIPAGKSVCIASSRLGRNLDEQDEWFDALRTLAVRLDPQTHFFVTSAGTTTDTYVRHLCRRFGFSAVDVLPWIEEISLRFAQAQTESTSLVESDPNPSSVGSISSDSTIFPAYCLPLQSPLIATDCIDPASIIANLQSRPFDPDATLIRIAAECYLLSIRPQGNIHRAVLDRIADSNQFDSEPSRTWIMVSKRTKKSSLHRDLFKAGAFGWWLFNEAQDAIEADPNKLTEAQPAAEQVSQQGAFSAPMLDLEEFPAENFLMHWTRDLSGPWPHQTDAEWLDDLIFQAERRQHGAAFALRRILATKQILASRKLTRDEQPVVCFSNRSLREIGELTVYRQHLSRWDFVPFGIAIDRDWLLTRGARPVIYGESEAWESLSETDRPFFQLVQSKSGKIDWTIEQEWRWLGNLNLREVPQQAVAVFVPSQQDADAIAPFCSWPILVLGIKMNRKIRRL